MSNKIICDACGKVLDEKKEYYILRRTGITSKRYGNWDLCSTECLKAMTVEIE
jgi:hypothetical protein